MHQRWFYKTNENKQNLSNYLTFKERRKLKDAMTKDFYSGEDWTRKLFLPRKQDKIRGNLYEFLANFN